MRLDKFLKVSRLIKRRTIAKQASDAQRIEINGKIARASAEVNVGDIITINLGMNPLKVKVLDVKEHVGKDEASELYEVV